MDEAVVSCPSIADVVVLNGFVIVFSLPSDDVVIYCLFDDVRSVTGTVAVSPLDEVVFFDEGTDVDVAVDCEE